VVGDDALFDDGLFDVGLFDVGLFAARAEERAAERLDVAAPLAVRMRPAAGTWPPPGPFGRGWATPATCP